MPRFVILEHDYPETHWDLMLEAGAVLRTWRLAEPPQSGKEVKAEPSFDHRLIYLYYEGPISGGRGRVCRWDSGSYRLERDDADRIVLHFSGERVFGAAELARTADGGWRFVVR